jgi:hypothetical protein
MYVGHKNTNLVNVPPTFTKFMSGHIFDINFHLPPQRAVPRHGEEPHAAAARRRRTLPLHAAASSFVARCRSPLPLPAATTSAAAAAHNRHTLYSAAAVADAFSDNNGETVVPSSGRLFNFIHALRPLIFPHCLQFFSRSCQEGQIF